MSEVFCYECVFEEKETNEMPCRACRRGGGRDYSYFVSREAVDLFVNNLIHKAFEEKGDQK